MRPQTSLDEMELVANAQGNATSDRESVHFSGIMRKVEVNHAVSFKIESRRARIMIIRSLVYEMKRMVQDVL